MTGRQGKADPLASLQHLAGGDALGAHAIGAEVGFELVEDVGILDLEAEEVDAGAIRLADDEAIVVAFVLGLEIDPPLRIAAGLLEPDHVGVEIDRLLQIQHPHLKMAGAQNACDCHDGLLPVVVPARLRAAPSVIVGGRPERSPCGGCLGAECGNTTLGATSLCRE